MKLLVKYTVFYAAGLSLLALIFTFFLTLIRVFISLFKFLLSPDSNTGLAIYLFAVGFLATLLFLAALKIISMLLAVTLKQAFTMMLKSPSLIFQPAKSLAKRGWSRAKQLPGMSSDELRQKSLEYYPFSRRLSRAMNRAAMTKSGMEFLANRGKGIDDGNDGKVASKNNSDKLDERSEKKIATNAEVAAKRYAGTERITSQELDALTARFQDIIKRDLLDGNGQFHRGMSDEEMQKFYDEHGNDELQKIRSGQGFGASRHDPRSSEVTDQILDNNQNKVRAEKANNVPGRLSTEENMRGAGEDLGDFTETSADKTQARFVNEKSANHAASSMDGLPIIDREQADVRAKKDFEELNEAVQGMAGDKATAAGEESAADHRQNLKRDSSGQAIGEVEGDQVRQAAESINAGTPQSIVVPRLPTDAASIDTIVAAVTSATNTTNNPTAKLASDIRSQQNMGHIDQAVIGQTDIDAIARAVRQNVEGVVAQRHTGNAIATSVMDDNLRNAFTRFLTAVNNGDMRAASAEKRIIERDYVRNVAERNPDMDDTAQRDTHVALDNALRHIMEKKAQRDAVPRAPQQASEVRQSSNSGKRV